ncbi:hypothetical protein V6N12_064721 [Hibiscus sabdariffa]|uniref:Uncharacterized protein n=1 Tax=Hibiscus sabdariffa TaxID=183260 RepID=A0ABR2G6L0_9ROSI
MKWFPNASIDAYINSLTASQPDGIQVIDLPQVDPPLLGSTTKSPESFIHAFIESYISPVRNVVRDIVSTKSSSDETRVSGLVLDLFLFTHDWFKDAKGIIVNTSEAIEQYALNYLSNGQNPSVYPVGPVIDFDGLSYSNSDDKVLKWLDDQPQSSVVFLCFGSMGSFKAPQVKQIALGLERSGLRLLWSLRVPPPHNDASEMLPEGFLERVQGRGMICDWAPQLKLNALKMAKELGLAVEMSELRKKVKEMSEMARKSVMEGGSSFNSNAKLIQDMLGNRQQLICNS